MPSRRSAPRSIRSSCSPMGAAATASITPGSPSFWLRTVTSWPHSTITAPTPTTRRLPTLANKLWQRPRDIGLSISFLLNDPFWGKSIDADRIGVAGHSQGGFTALWVGGARINPEKYLAFQRGWRNNQMVPEYLRNELPLDAAPALDVHDKRVKAVFAMAPGIVQAFGVDEAGLRQLTVPTYITVGAGDTQAPPKDNAEFAARNIPHAELYVIPGRVDHDIFINECNEDGRNEFPQACIDAPGIDRGKIHALIGDAALKFYDASLNVPRGK